MGDAEGVSVAALTKDAPSADPSSRPIATFVALLVLSLALDTDVYLVDVLANFGGTLRPNGAPNVKGSIIRSLTLVLLFALVVVLIRHGVI